MRVFVAGATGVVGRRIVVLLNARGHVVTGMSRSPDKAAEVRAMGAEPVFADALDREAVMQLVAQAQPEVVIDELTALKPVLDTRHFDAELAETNRLRTVGTDHLLDAAIAAGARRFIAQSYTNWPNAREGSPVQAEDDPHDPNPPATQRSTVEAIRYLEHRVVEARGIEGIVLRYGNLYGPGTAFANDGAMAQIVRKRRFPIVGSGEGVWSFVHVEDAARATVLCLTKGTPGIYNITDDEPAPVTRWLPELATALGAPRPRHVPAWLARFSIGKAGVSMMTQIRGSSNAKARRELGLCLMYPTWRFGFRRDLVTVRRRREAPSPVHQGA